MSAKIREATSTKVELLCNSLNLGQETFVLISSIESLINAVNFSIVKFSLCAMHGWRDSNSQPTVLETATLPLSYTRICCPENGLQK
jgi:hypothetical protein